MGEKAYPPPPPVDVDQTVEKPWHSYLSEDLPRTLQQSTDSAVRSVRSLKKSSSTHLRAIQDIVPLIRSRYQTHEEAFFHKAKGELGRAREHPAAAGAVVVTAAFLLMRGPRRFLFRHTLARFRSEEAQFLRAERNVKDLRLSVDLMKKESRKLIERASLAEKDMKRGHSDLMDAGTQLRSLARSIYKAEAGATDLMDLLRETSGREALKLRAEVASMASYLCQQRTLVDKRMMKISELGIPV